MARREGELEYALDGVEKKLNSFLEEGKEVYGLPGTRTR